MTAHNVFHDVCLVFGAVWAVWTVKLWLLAAFSSNVKHKTLFPAIQFSALWAGKLLSMCIVTPTGRPCHLQVGKV